MLLPFELDGRGRTGEGARLDRRARDRSASRPAGPPPARALRRPAAARRDRPRPRHPPRARLRRRADRQPRLPHRARGARAAANAAAPTAAHRDGDPRPHGREPRGPHRLPRRRRGSPRSGRMDAARSPVHAGPGERRHEPAATRARRCEHGPGVLVAALSSAFGVALVQGTGCWAPPSAATPSRAQRDRRRAAADLRRLRRPRRLRRRHRDGEHVLDDRRRAGAEDRAAAAPRLDRPRAAWRGRDGRASWSVSSARSSAARSAPGVAIASAAIAIAIGIVPGAVLLLGSGADPAAGAVLLTTWAASWVGSRRVLSVTPLQALGGAEEPPRGGERARAATRSPCCCVIVGRRPAARRRSSASEPGRACSSRSSAGSLSFTGIVFGAHLMIPPALRVVGRMWGDPRRPGSPPRTRCATRSAARAPPSGS